MNKAIIRNGVHFLSEEVKRILLICAYFLPVEISGDLAGMQLTTSYICMVYITVYLYLSFFSVYLYLSFYVVILLGCIVPAGGERPVQATRGSAEEGEISHRERAPTGAR